MYYYCRLPHCSRTRGCIQETLPCAGALLLLYYCTTAALLLYYRFNTALLLAQAERRELMRKQWGVLVQEIKDKDAAVDPTTQSRQVDKQ